MAYKSLSQGKRMLALSYRVAPWSVKGMTQYAKIGRLECTVDFDESDLQTLKDYTPVDTGTLRDAWVLDGMYIYNMTSYAVFVEFGHRTVSGGWVPGQFYATNAMTEISRKYTERLGKFIEQNVDKLFDPNGLVIHLGGAV